MRQHASFGKLFARTLLHEGGGLGGVRFWNRNGFRILMYHNFSGSAPGMQESLAKQCAHLTRHYKIVTLTEIARCLRERKRLPANAVAVTVDDGYQDFLNGYPVFRAYKIPVTVFLVSGFLDRKLWLWWDKLGHLIENSPRPAFQAALSPALPPMRFNLGTDAQRRQALGAMTKAIKKLNNEERDQVMDALPGLLDVDLPHEPPAHAAPLDWVKLRNLSESTVEFGAHTLTHPILSRIADPAELHLEIWNSKRRIEQELRRPIIHFSYPYGLPQDFNDDTLQAVDNCMFQSAVTTEKGLDARGTDPFRLKRIGVEPTMSEFYFKEMVAGLHAEE